MKMQMEFRCNDDPILYHFHDKARYWPTLANFCIKRLLVRWHRQKFDQPKTALPNWADLGRRNVKIWRKCIKALLKPMYLSQFRTFLYKTPLIWWFPCQGFDRVKTMLVNWTIRSPTVKIWWKHSLYTVHHLRDLASKKKTSVSETISKPPFVKAQTALRKQKKIKYGEKRFSMWRVEFLHPAMWHVALGSWQ